MRVQLANNYVVDIDEHNHTLKFISKPHFKDDGTMSKLSEKVIGYYRNMEKALNAALKDCVATSAPDAEMKFEEYIHMLKLTQEEFNNQEK